MRNVRVENSFSYFKFLYTKRIKYEIQSDKCFFYCHFAAVAISIKATLIFV